MMGVLGLFLLEFLRIKKKIGGVCVLFCLFG